MLAEVANQQVSPRPRDSGSAHVLCRELVGQSVEQPDQRVERLEHFGVASRIRASSGHFVASVLAEGARGAEKLPTLGQGVTDGVLQFRRYFARQLVGLSVDIQQNRFSVSRRRYGTLITREERDQESAYSVACLYIKAPK